MHRLTKASVEVHTYAAENNGGFTGANLPKVQAIEPTLKDTSTAAAQAVTVETGGEGFTVESIAKGSGDTYKLINKKGEIERKCSPTGKGGCTASGTW